MILRPGDRVVSWSIDQLGGSLTDLKTKVEEVRQAGASIEFIKERMSFSSEASDPHSELLLNMMGAFAQFEREIMHQRQAEGIAILST